MSWVNTWFLRDLRSPFGGIGLSGIGREGGESLAGLLHRADQCAAVPSALSRLDAAQRSTSPRSTNSRSRAGPRRRLPDPARAGRAPARAGGAARGLQAGLHQQGEDGADGGLRDHRRAAHRRHAGRPTAATADCAGSSTRASSRRSRSGSAATSTGDDIAQCVDAVAPALEIIDSRYRDFRFSLPGRDRRQHLAAGFVDRRLAADAATWRPACGWSSTARSSRPDPPRRSSATRCARSRSWPSWPPATASPCTRAGVILAGAATAAVPLTAGAVEVTACRARAPRR